MAFDPRQLSAFLAIARHGSIGRAAEILHLTQPALSRTVKRLEEQIGAPLFERNAKGMVLTSFGEALLPHASLMSRVAEHASEEIDALRGLTKGTIRIGGIASTLAHLLPRAIDRVLKRWPNLHVQVIEGVWDRLAEALVKHEIDLALGVDIALDEDSEIEAVADCHWEDLNYIVAGANHPLRQQKTIRLADTLAYPWTSAPRGTQPYEHVHEVMKAHGLGGPNIVLETRSIITLKSFVLHAGLLCWMPGPMFEDERQAGLLSPLPIDELSAPRTLTVFRRRHGILPTPAAKLLEELRQMVKEGAVI
jgi:DNA-binding transcriptional LysR family regulator